MGFHKTIHLAGTVTVGPKGQIVIPADVRESMQIGPGDKLVAFYLDEKKSITFVTERQAQEQINRMGEQLVAFRDSLQKGDS